MGKSIYYILIAASILLGLIFSQKKESRKTYVIITAILHALVSGLRYQFLTGDLIRYNTLFQDYRYFGWFSEEVFQEGRNFGFQWMMKAVCHITDGNFLIFLFLIAVIIEIIVAIIIYRYSPLPWLSYAMWNCLGFYVFGFSAVKQSLAMAILMLSYMCIIEKKPKQFVFWTVAMVCGIVVCLKGGDLMGNTINELRLYTPSCAPSAARSVIGASTTLVRVDTYGNATFVRSEACLKRATTIL